MLQSLFVPEPISIEHEHFLALLALEYKSLIKCTVEPQEPILNCVCVNFLKSRNVNVVQILNSEHRPSVEDNLLCLRVKLCVVSEVFQVSVSPWKPQQIY